MEKVVEISRLDPATAATLLAGVERLDPRGVLRPADLAGICERGLCFAATTPGGQVAYVLNVKNGVAWIDAAQGAGLVDLTRAVLPCIELQCSELAAIGFTTARPGLKHKAEKMGYRVTGWHLKKDLQCAH